MNLPIVIVGAGAGFSFGYDGPTHHGHQDVSSMRLMPEMHIIELSSNDVAVRSVDYAVEAKSPCYIRLDKGPFPDLSSVKALFSEGYRILRPLKAVNLISNGYTMREVMLAADILNERDIDVGIVDLFRFKPLPKNLLAEVVGGSEILVSVEESCRTGGLGTALSELIL